MTWVPAHSLLPTGHLLGPPCPVVQVIGHPLEDLVCDAWVLVLGVVLPQGECVGPIEPHCPPGALLDVAQGNGGVVAGVEPDPVSRSSHGPTPVLR